MPTHLRMPLSQAITSVTRLPGEGHAWQLLRLGHMRCAANEGVRRQHYPGHDWLLCVSGRATYGCGDSSGTVAPGQLLWFDNKLPHFHQADYAKPWEVLWLRFSALYGQLVARAPGLGSTACQICPDAARWTECWQQMQALAHSEGDQPHIALGLEMGLLDMLKILSGAKRRNPAPGPDY